MRLFSFIALVFYGILLCTSTYILQCNTFALFKPTYDIHTNRKNSAEFSACIIDSASTWTAIIACWTCLLLLQCGDVELNPGPPKRIDSGKPSISDGDTSAKSIVCVTCNDETDTNDAFTCYFCKKNEHFSCTDFAPKFCSSFKLLPNEQKSIFHYCCSPCRYRNIPNIAMNSLNFMQRPATIVNDFTSDLIAFSQPMPNDLNRPHPPVAQQSRSLIDTLRTVAELNERSTRAVGFNIPASNGSAAENKQSDLAKLRSLAAELDFDPGDITDCYRLGRPDPDRPFPRLLKVQFKSAHARNEWLAASFKQSRPGRDRTWFRRDLSEDERKEAKEAYEKKKLLKGNNTVPRNIHA
jgi:hypothetical protein